MHDPMSVAFEVNIPFTGKKNKKGHWETYPKNLFTVWHVDPEKDGTDDSCGWFIRARHCNQETLKKIKKSFVFEMTELYDESLAPRFSPMAITLQLFSRACYDMWGDWKKVERYMQAHLYELIRFSENSTDSLCNAINRKTPHEERAEDFATIIYPYILRSLRPWWKHPRWHVHHWEIQFTILQKLKRYLWGRCAGCGGRFTWGYSPTTTDWDGEGPQWFRSERNIYHGKCLHAIVAKNAEAVGGGDEPDPLGMDIDDPTPDSP